MNNLHRAVPASRPSTLDGVDDASDPVFQKIWQVLNGVRMWENVPASGRVPIVIEPGAEDEICSNAKEEAVTG